MRRLARERLGIEADVIDTGHLPALKPAGGPGAQAPWTRIMLAEGAMPGPA
jgi:hypothetical protein